MPLTWPWNRHRLTPAERAQTDSVEQRAIQQQRRATELVEVADDLLLRNGFGPKIHNALMGGQGK